MKKGFFSFVAITLVALVLFVAASYLVIFKDFRYAAEKDLEVRRVAERMEDMRETVNKTIVDAAVDAGYAMWGCDATTFADDYCDRLYATLANYSGKMALAFSDNILANATVANFLCANATTSPYGFWNGIPWYPFNEFYDDEWNAKLFVNITKRINGTILLNASSANVRHFGMLNFSFDADLTKTRIEAGNPPMDDVFVIRLVWQGINASVYNYSLGVYC
ncbi:MAG: hypothetical protein ABIG96_04860 [Candidatus Micrarchaeota archaeon]